MADPRESPSSAAPRRARRHVLGKLLLALAGLAVGLALAEVIFRLRDQAGFPKLNVYREDATLGVRLEPGAAQRLVFPGNPSTSVRINADGYRGPAFPPPSDDDVLVVGDSQVFGLGVEEGETFSAALERELGGGRHVLNGGVPTYGPEEYVAVARELLERRHPKTVVFTVNIVNDLFEAGRPNRSRHVVRDGWAVRSDVAADLLEFPGRRWLARRSHLFYAVRSLWHRDTDGQAAASEGTWRDLVSNGAKRTAQQAATQVAQRARTEELQRTEFQLGQRAEEIDRAIASLLRDELSEDELLDVGAAHQQPGAIVERFEANLEEARTVIVTAAHIARGAKLRAKLRSKLARVAAKERDRERRKRILASLEDEPRLAARLETLGAEQIEASLDSPVAPAIRELAQLCDAQGARLVILILPIDVAVSAEEWKKYGAPPQDMSGVAALHAELVELGARLGVTTLDATAALREAEPGAFLNHDIHMTPRGHAAVAAALAAALAAPPPPRRADAPSAVPLPSQWNAVREINVAGSTEASCETKVVREWLRVLCTPRDYAAATPTRLIVRSDSTGAAMVLVMPRSASLVVPVGRGDRVTIEFQWPNAVRVLEVGWPETAPALTAAFSVQSRDPTGPAYTYNPKFETDAHRQACSCWQRVYDQARDPSPQDPACPGIYGELSPGCAAYADRCSEQVACLIRDPSSPPLRGPDGGPPVVPSLTPIPTALTPQP
ncbi:MAG: hypothetical protein R3B48_10370 [Kofleriaceae bacterium]